MGTCNSVWSGSRFGMASFLLVLVIIAVVSANPTTLRKCCPMGQQMVSYKCVPGLGGSFSGDFDVTFNRSLLEDYGEFEVAIDKKCSHDKIWLNQAKTDFGIALNGRLLWPYSNTTIEVDTYCLDVSNGHWGAFICDTSNHIVIYILCAGMITSIIFLLTTFTIYVILLPDRNNIQTKCQMAYVFSLMFSFVILVLMRLLDLESVACHIFGAIALFSLQSSFCWMNICCYDIFRTFGRKRSFSASKNVATLKRFALYCIYGYGVPLIMVTLIITMNEDDVNLWFHPVFGFKTCCIKCCYPEPFYTDGLIVVQQISNIIMFVLTALAMRKINQDTAVLRTDENNKHYDTYKQRFNIYIKLLIAMGIDWSLNYISWLVDWLLNQSKYSYVWIVADFCGTMNGVLIFYLFIWKQTTWLLLKKRYYIYMDEPQKAQAVSMRTTTTTTGTSGVKKISMIETISSKF